MFKKLPIDASKLTIFFFIAMLTLISGILRTIPVGAYSKNFTNLPDEVPRLNSEIIEKKFLNDFLKKKMITKNYRMNLLHPKKKSLGKI